MSQNTNSKEQRLFSYNAPMPPIGQAIPLALQHVVAMIVGTVTPAIIVSNIAGVTQDQRVLLIQAALIVSAISTLLQLFPLVRKSSFQFGSGLPVILGISFAYVPSLQAIAALDNGLAAIAGSMIVGGIVAVIVGMFLKKIRRFFPPLITGTVVLTIGLSLYPTAINYMAGGASNSYDLIVTTKGLTEALVYGSWQNWLVALITLGLVVFLSNFTKGFTKLAAILLGLVGGYIVSIFFGMVDFSAIGSAGIISAPSLLPFGIRFDVASCVAIGLLFAINSIQAIGDFTATTVGGMNREPSDNELQGGIVCYGATNILCSFFGGLPTATYSQNVGIVSTNKVVNRWVMAIAAAIILFAGIFPKFSAALTTIPQCVLGGATASVFATIAMTGIKLLTSQGLTPRNTAIVGLALALGMGLSQAPASLGQFPESITMIFGKSPVVVSTIVALLLNQILPGKEAPKSIL